MLLTIVAFAVALGLLISVHEYGHYCAARACGVKVLQFSIGFGPALARWRPKGSQTEFLLSAFPLGGYVRMLGEGGASPVPVPAAERHLAFESQPLLRRTAIAAAGPLANLLLAVLLYAMVNWSGVEEPRARLASPLPGSIAQRAGLQGGELVEAAAPAGQDLQPLRSFEELRWLLVRSALDGENLRLALHTQPGARQRELVLDMSAIDGQEDAPQLLAKIGITGPWTRPELGQIVAGGAAQRAGLRAGDLVLQVGGTEVVDGAQLRLLIRQSVRANAPWAQVWRIERAGRQLDIEVLPDLAAGDPAAPAGSKIGRIGAVVGALPQMVLVEYGVLDGAWAGAVKTWEMAGLTLRTIGRMLIGDASVKNLSGPLTIADLAGRAANVGLTQYLAFLAFLSMSLGVLNLLPLPMLDGGHLMYYLWEAVTGRGVSVLWTERLQRGGLAVLLLMMSVALFNDISRLFF